MVLPLGSVYSRVSPTFASIRAPPSGELGGVDLDLVAPGALLAGGDEERLLVAFVAVVVDRDDRAGQRDAGLRGRDTDLRVVQQFLQLTNPGLLLTLLLASGVVSTVLLEVALLAALVDLGRDDGTIRDELVEFCLESVVRLLCQPGHLGLGHPRSLPSGWSSRLRRLVAATRSDDGNADPSNVPPKPVANRTALLPMQQYTAPKGGTVYQAILAPTWSRPRNPQRAVSARAGIRARRSCSRTCPPCPAAAT